MRLRLRGLLPIACLLAAGCGNGSSPAAPADGGPPSDASANHDGSGPDGASGDGAPSDTGSTSCAT
ncbi:MAG TPA: hypothetical protein VIY73_15100, partial [Polyangiaceae bacterium]